MLRKCKNLDERQLWIRGNVFQHTLILLFVLLMITGVLKEEGIVLAEGMGESILLLWLSFTLCFCEFILRGISPLGTAMPVLYTILGIAGAFLAGRSLFCVLTGDELFAVGITLTRCGTFILEGGMMVLIFLVFLGKRLFNCLCRQDEE